MSGNTYDVLDTDLNDVRQECVSFIDNTLATLGISRYGQISSAIVNKLRKDVIVELFEECFSNLNNLTGCTTNCENGTSCMKTQFIESQQTVIKLQKELLACKDEQLNSVEVAVKASVEDSVKAEFRSYSSVVANSRVQENSANQAAIKKAVQNAVKDEDRSKNVMIFGLPEKSDEEINSTVSEVFQAIGEKPRLDACRLGRIKSDKSKTVSRPVKVTFASATVVDQILSKTKKLVLSEKFKSVFVCPDRSIEQRTKQRELIKDLRKKIINEPEKRHFISGGKIFSVARSGK